MSRVAQVRTVWALIAPASSIGIGSCMASIHNLLCWGHCLCLCSAMCIGIGSCMASIHNLLCWGHCLCLCSAMSLAAPRFLHLPALSMLVLPLLSLPVLPLQPRRVEHYPGLLEEAPGDSSVPECNSTTLSRSHCGDTSSNSESP